MQPPDKIYRYQPPTAQAIASLSASQLWFSDPRGFNDPYDCALELIDLAVRDSLSNITRDQCLVLADHLLSGEEVSDMERHRDMDVIAKKDDSELRNIVAFVMRDNIKEVLKGFGACCFARKVDNLLMWSHYADSHRGFCMEFDTSKDPFDAAEDVQYSDYYPELDLEKLLSNKEPVLREYLYTKANCWRHEGELRIFNRSPNAPFDFQPSALTAVYCGSKMQRTHHEMISKLLRETDTKLYSMHLEQGSFKLSPSAFC